MEDVYTPSISLDVSVFKKHKLLLFSDKKGEPPGHILFEKHVANNLTEFKTLNSMQILDQG